MEQLLVFLANGDYDWCGKNEKILLHTHVQNGRWSDEK